MNIGDTHYRTIWCDDPAQGVHIIDQTKLPFELEFAVLRTAEDAFNAIRNMQVRGAPLVGATAAYGMAPDLGTTKNDFPTERYSS